MPLVAPYCVQSSFPAQLIIIMQLALHIIIMQLVFSTWLPISSHISIHTLDTFPTYPHSDGALMQVKKKSSFDHEGQRLSSDCTVHTPWHRMFFWLRQRNV